MAKHYIHYFKRRIKTRVSKKEEDAFWAQPQDEDAGFDQPEFHTTRRGTGPASEIVEGDVIWLISLIESPWGKTRASLDGKVIVGKVEKPESESVKFHADQGSKWYNLNDIENHLALLKSTDSKGRIKDLVPPGATGIGLYLQSIRRLANPEILIERANELDQTPFDFISYRIKDGTKPAFMKVQELLANNKLVFWDRYGLPRRLSERKEQVDTGKLDAHLMNKIAEASTVWGIESPLYKEKDSYSEKEYNMAVQLDKYEKVEVSNS